MKLKQKIKTWYHERDYPTVYVKGKGAKTLYIKKRIIEVYDKNTELLLSKTYATMIKAVTGAYKYMKKH